MFIFSKEPMRQHGRFDRVRHYAPSTSVCLSLAAALTLSACASVNLNDDLQHVQTMAALPTDTSLSLHRSSEEMQMAQIQANALLDQPLVQADVVRLMLLNSPQMQSMLASHLADASQAAQKGRLLNPVFTFERLRSLDEFELGRQIAFGLIDWLTWPLHMKTAEQAMQAQRLTLGMQVTEQLTQVRQAWVNAVAAEQAMRYAQQVSDVAQAGAELATRMADAGNFSTLQRDKERMFFAQATAQLTAAQHTQLAARETLVRMLGLTEAQAEKLQLPSRLPDLPDHARTPNEVAEQGSRSRLDVQLAQAQYARLMSGKVPAIVDSITDIELELRRERVQDRATGNTERRSGEAISIRLPIFDWGDLRREQLDAQALLSLNHLEATVRNAQSHLRESYSAYQVAYRLASHYQREVIPMRKRMSQQELLRYNGMLIGVFELLADARAQIDTVKAGVVSENGK